jgi:hypothetical protein
MTASPEHPRIHQDQERHSDQEQREHKARNHHIILCNTACFATWGSA